MTTHILSDSLTELTVVFDTPVKAPKRVYSIEEVKEQIQWHNDRVKVLEARIANQECTEEK